jgi:hypothetical protein
MLNERGRTMGDRRVHQLLSRIAVTLAVAAGSLATFGGPASAYSPNPSARYAKVETQNLCNRVAGTLTVIYQTNGCFLDDSVDYTLFRWDAGGWGVKIELRTSSGLVAKVEFHPYDEILWVYDTRDDGDTIYVDVVVDWQSIGLYRGPANGAASFNLNIAEGKGVFLDVWDDNERTDLIFSTWGIA